MDPRSQHHRQQQQLPRARTSAYALSNSMYTTITTNDERVQRPDFPTDAQVRLQRQEMEQQRRIEQLEQARQMNQISHGAPACCALANALYGQEHSRACVLLCVCDCNDRRLQQAGACRDALDCCIAGTVADILTSRFMRVRVLVAPPHVVLLPREHHGHARAQAAERASVPPVRLLFVLDRLGAACGVHSHNACMCCYDMYTDAACTRRARSSVSDPLASEALVT